MQQYGCMDVNMDLNRFYDCHVDGCFKDPLKMEAGNCSTMDEDMDDDKLPDCFNEGLYDDCFFAVAMPCDSDGVEDC